MKRSHLSTVALLLTTTAGAFSACTFGADDFKIVEANGNGGDGSGDTTSGGSDTAGSSATGGTDTTHGGTSNGGTVAAGGAGGSPLEEGGGGAGPTLPNFLCAPQAEPFPILAVADLQMSSINQVQVAPSRNGAVVVVSGPNMARPNTSRLVYRFVRDSNGGTADALGSVDYMNGRLNLAATMVTPKDEVHITALDGNTIFEYRVGLPLNAPLRPAPARTSRVATTAISQGAGCGICRPTTLPPGSVTPLRAARAQTEWRAPRTRSTSRSQRAAHRGRCLARAMKTASFAATCAWGSRT